MDFTEMLVRVVSFPWVNPQEKRQATAPAVMAAAMEEPVFRVREMEPDGAVCLPGQAGSAGQNPRSLHVDAGGSKVRLDLSGGGEAAAAVDVEDAGDMIVCADGQKQRRISRIGDGDVRVRTEKAGVLREKSLHGEPDMKLPGDKQCGIDPDMPDTGSRSDKAQEG